ncbi:MAG: hypothetical protein OEY03_13975, partial [Rhizobacter sp.]|nr:hypothetical protein [Rhizobacter sp.]
PLAALARFADGFYDGLLRERKDEVERILLELVRIDRMLEPYRRPRLRSELLAGGSPRTPEVLALLERQDFVRITPTADGMDAAVEVKHEALLRNWPRYIDWINGKRERVRQRIALSEAAQRWFDGGCSATEGLLGAWQLKEVERLADLSPLETRYMQASAEAADRERIAREDALRRQERRKWIFGFAILLLAVIIGGAWYVDRQGERRLALRQTADVQIQMARARDASARGQLDDALTGALRALAAARSLEAEDGAGALRAQAREMLLSNLRHAADLRRMFVADGAVFRSVAFHPTHPDVLLAFAGADGRTYVAGLDAPLAQTLDSCGAAVTMAVVFDPAGRWLAAGCDDGTLSVWSTDDWRKLGGVNKPVFDRRIWAIAASPDGRLIAAAGRRNQVALVALADDGTPTESPPALVLAGDVAPSGSVWSLAFAPAGDRLLVGDGAGAVLACKTETAGAWRCERTQAYPGDPDDAILALAYSADGARIAVGRWKGGAEVWDAAFTARSRRPIDVGRSLGPVHSLAFFDACGRRQLAIGKGVELLYRPVDEAPQPPVAPDSCATPRQASVGDEANGIAVHGPTGRVAAATRGGYVAVFDSKGGPDPLRTANEQVDSAGVGPLRGVIVAEQKPVDGALISWLAVPIGPPGPDGANLELLRLSNGRIEDAGSAVRRVGGVGEIQRVSASRRTRRLATLGSSGVSVWRLADDPAGPDSLTPLVALDTRDFDALAPRRIALSPDGRWLVVSFTQGGRLLATSLDDDGGRSWLEAGVKVVHEIAFSHDGGVFGAGGEASQKKAGAGEDEVRLWKVGSSGFELAPHSPLPLSATANKVYELGFAADEHGQALLLAGGESGAIDRWDVGSGRRLDTLRAGSWPVHLIAFSPTGALVAAADYQNVVRLWDTSSWIPLQLTPPTDRFERPGFLAFGGDGTWLATGAGALQLWDL